MAKNDHEIIRLQVDTTELVQMEADSKQIVTNPKAEESLLKLLELQKEIDGCVEYVKAEIERQALAYNPNFTTIKGKRVKINYSASGAKYKASNDNRHSSKFWKKKVSWSIDSKAVDEFRAKEHRLPRGIKEVLRRKTIRISEVKGDE